MRKTQRGSYTEEDLWKAIKAVKGGASLKPTAIEYGILYKALRRYRDGKVKKPEAVQLGR